MTFALANRSSCSQQRSRIPSNIHICHVDPERRLDVSVVVLQLKNFTTAVTSVALLFRADFKSVSMTTRVCLLCKKMLRMTVKAGEGGGWVETELSSDSWSNLHSECASSDARLRSFRFLRGWERETPTFSKAEVFGVLHTDRRGWGGGGRRCSDGKKRGEQSNYVSYCERGRCLPE